MAAGGGAQTMVTHAPPAVGDIQEVSIEGLSSEGAGVGHLADGRAVFVPLTAPGERVRVRVGRVKARWAAAELLEVLDPAPERRPALCTLYGSCGGCRVQHVSEAEQRKWKARTVQETLGRIGGIEDLALPEVIPSPRSVGYRNRMSFTLRRLAGGRVVAGLHALANPAHVIDVDGECVLPEPELRGTWRSLRRAWGPGARLLPGGGRLRLTLHALSDRSTVLEVEGGTGPWDPMPLLDACAALETIVHREVKTGPRTVYRRSGAQSGPSIPLGFEQVNTGAADLLRDYVLVEAGNPDRVVDAYCGSGSWGHALAESGARVVGIELDPDAARSGTDAAPAGFAMRTGAVEALLAAELPADLVIVNPPRTGMGPDVVRALLRTPPERLIYVSCDPATLARDLSGLTAGFTLERIRCFDLFPQTAHVETVVTMSRNRDR